MARAQQRTGRARGQEMRSNAAHVPTLDWVYLREGVQATVIGVYDWPEGTALRGLPAVRLIGTDAYVMQVETTPWEGQEGGMQVTVFWSEPVPGDAIFEWEQNDPWLGTPIGGRMSGGKAKVNPIAPAVGLSPMVVDASTVALRASLLDEPYCVAATPEGWECEGQPATAWVYPEGQLGLSFGLETPVTVGAVLRKTSGVADNITLSGKRIPLGEWVLV